MLWLLERINDTNIQHLKTLTPHAYKNSLEGVEGFGWMLTKQALQNPLKNRQDGRKRKKEEKGRNQKKTNEL